MCASALLAVGSWLPAAETPHPWVVVRAAELEVYSNASERIAANVAEDLLLMREVLGKVGKMDTSSRVPTRVFVFRDTKTFAPVARALFGSEMHKSGVFAWRGDLRIIAIDGSTLGARQIAYHELVHQYANATWPELPVWFNEGIAEFYSNFAVSARTVHVGRPNIRHIRWIRRTGLIPMREFLLADEHSRWYTSTLDQQRFYAQSWLLVHYLMLMREGDLPRFLAELQKKQPIDEAWVRVFRMTYGEMGRILINYARRPVLNPLTYPIERLSIEPVPPAQPATYEEVQALVDELLAVSVATPLGVDEARARLSAQSEAERERRNAERQEQFEKLLVQYDKAVEHVRDGEYDDARRILDEIIPKLEELGTNELLDVAKELREQLPK